MFWNPLTGIYKKLSKVPSPLLVNSLVDNPIGFYFDSSNDYKLLLMLGPLHGSMSPYIYSHRMDSWRKIGPLENKHRNKMDLWSPAIFSGQSLYFMAIDMSTTIGTFIIGFDVKSEKFREIALPPVHKDGLLYSGSLAIVNGCVHLCAAYANYLARSEGDLVQSEGDMWRMDGDRWVKTITFYHGPYYSLKLSFCHKICITRSANWLAIMENNNSFQKINLEKLTTNYCMNFYGNWMCPPHRTIYIETLVSPNP